jgi:colanic acid biosynthesis protein WcaH
MTYLAADVFTKVIDSTPLISIDMIVYGPDGRLLFGKRENRPAKNFLFVPGGRIMKNESFQIAFSRLLREELNLTLDDVDVTRLGLYEHFYDDSVFCDVISTHYVVNAYQVRLKKMPTKLPKSQHSAFQWKNVQDILEDSEIHEHSKWYFQLNKNADFKVFKHG